MNSKKEKKNKQRRGGKIQIQYTIIEVLGVWRQKTKNKKQAGKIAAPVCNNGGGG